MTFMERFVTLKPSNIGTFASEALADNFQMVWSLKPLWFSFRSAMKGLQFGRLAQSSQAWKTVPSTFSFSESSRNFIVTSYPMKAPFSFMQHSVAVKTVMTRFGCIKWKVPGSTRLVEMWLSDCRPSERWPRQKIAVAATKNDPPKSFLNSGLITSRKATNFLLPTNCPGRLRISSSDLRWRWT